MGQTEIVANPSAAQALNHESSQIPSVPLEAVLVMDKKLDCVNLTGGKLAWC